MSFHFAFYGVLFCRIRYGKTTKEVQTSLGQLQNRYPNNLWAEIIGNMDIQLMLGCTDEVSAKYFSERSGEMSIEVNSTMTTRKTIAIAQIIPQYRHTQGLGKRKLLTPDEVLRLPNEKLLCVVRGCNVLMLDKLDFTRHPYSKLIKKISVYDYSQNVICGVTKAESEIPETASKLYSSANPPKNF